MNREVTAAENTARDSIGQDEWCTACSTPTVIEDASVEEDEWNGDTYVALGLACGHQQVL